MIELSAPLRDLLLDGYGEAFPEGSTLEFLAMDGATVLATFSLPADAWAPSANGQKKLAAPLTTYALGAGNVGSYRLSNGEFVERGTVTGPDGGGDITISDVALVPGTMVTVHTFTKVA